ncbi:MAG: ABC transporter permease [Firmicutes bacterium]|nr:ABC transporter permease [Bacillota bacterium]
MGRYVVTRLAQGLLLILVVSILVFALVHLMPGDPVEIVYGTRMSAEKREELRVQMGLDKPVPVQYMAWLTRILHGDFGVSNKTLRPVAQSFKSRIPVTLKISLSSMLLELLLGVPLGLLAAYKKDSLFDRIFMAFASFMQAVPGFWLAMLMILFFGAKLGWLPVNGVGTWKHYVLPVASIVLVGFGGSARIFKAEVLEVYREKYIQTAFAKGLSRRAVIIRHVLRNAIILVVVMTCMSLPWIFSGSVILEKIFAIPGMGSYTVDAVAAKDFAVVQANVLIITALIVICNMASDIIVAALDPRVRIAISGGGK